MKSHYPVNHLLVAYFLLISFLLQSCYNPSIINQTNTKKIGIEEIEEEKLTKLSNQCNSSVNNLAQESLNLLKELEERDEHSIYEQTASNRQHFITTKHVQSTYIHKPERKSILKKENSTRGPKAEKINPKKDQRGAMMRIGPKKLILSHESYDQPFISKEGHNVWFKQLANEKWEAIVEEYLPVGIKRRHLLTVFCMSGYSIESISTHSRAWQKRHIHVTLTKDKSYVVVGKIGLPGGMVNGNDNDDKQEYEEDRSELPIPNEFICPISQEIMEDPVIAADGHTYDRPSIEKWFNTKEEPSSPKTGAKLCSKVLIPNFSLRSLIQDFKEKRKKEVSRARPSEIILFCGNPGVGKSSLCNSIFKRNVFESGYKLGVGMTEKEQEYVYENRTYIDTPGLSDIFKRKEKAKEIEEALKKNNNYKVIFVLTLEAGRFRAEDFATINTICEAITIPFEYGIILNKISDSGMEEISEKGGIERVLEPYLEFLSKKLILKNSFIIKKDKEIEDKKNVYLTDSVQRTNLLNFISTLKANNIKSREVQEIDTTSYKEKVEELERKLAAMYGTITLVGAAVGGITLGGIIATVFYLKVKK